jgi:hypothetical protein
MNGILLCIMVSEGPRIEPWLTLSFSVPQLEKEISVALDYYIATEV